MRPHAAPHGKTWDITPLYGPSKGIIGFCLPSAGNLSRSSTGWRRSMVVRRAEVLSAKYRVFVLFCGQVCGYLCE